MITPGPAIVAALTAIVAALSSCQPAEASPASTGPTVGVVDHVTDGDTVRVTGVGTIRIRGLDTPETKKPRTPVQCGGPEATAYASYRLLGRKVRLVTDPGDLHDRYGRTVAEVWLLDGSSYAEDAVREGMGKAYLYKAKHPASNWPAILAAQANAQAAHRGMWACPAAR